MEQILNRWTDKPVSVPIDNFGGPARRVFHQVNCSLQRLTWFPHNAVSNLSYRHWITHILPPAWL